MAKSKAIMKVGQIQQRILLIRGEKVIIDADLAEAPTDSLQISCFISPRKKRMRW